MTIVIVGGSGFIGTHLTRRLQAEGQDVRIVDVVPSRLMPEASVAADVRDEDALRRVFADASAVVLLAAEHRDDVRDPSRYYSVNVDGMTAVCRAAECADVSRIIFTSSVAVYDFGASHPIDELTTPAPTNHYGRSKLLAEQVLERWRKSSDDRRAVIVRPTAVLGEGSKGNIRTLIASIRAGRFVMVGRGRNRKSLCYVGNLVSLLALLLRETPKELTVNAVDKPDFTMGALVRFIRKELGVARLIDRVRVPYSVAVAGGQAAALAGRVLGREVQTTALRIRKFRTETMVESKVFGQMPLEPRVPLEEGLRSMIRAFDHEVSQSGPKPTRIGW